MNKPNVLTIALSAIVAAVVSFIVHVTIQPPVTPIAIIDYGNVVASLTSETTDAEREKLMGAVETQIRKLTAAGFLVLNSNSVLGAPGELKVPVPSIKTTTGIADADMSESKSNDQ